MKAMIEAEGLAKRYPGGVQALDGLSAARLAIVDRGQVVVTGTPGELKAKLRGDSVQVELAEQADRGGAHAAVEALPGMREVTVDGRTLQARVDDGARAVPVVLQALEARRIPVASATMARPSLDDVYLRFAGRTFAAADEATAQPAEVA
jgi:ABC-2 type transport system ATP-binding protein